MCYDTLKQIKRLKKRVWDTGHRHRKCEGHVQGMFCVFLAVSEQELPVLLLAVLKVAGWHHEVICMKGNLDVMEVRWWRKDLH